MTIPGDGCCPVLELRQYTLHPGQRDVLIELFDREFVESQEVLGMRIAGQFRDLDDPDRFVWLRGFTDMERRKAGLSGFYGGPVWAAHGAAANATMITSDDVLLLRPTSRGSGFPTSGEARPPVGSEHGTRWVIAATVHHLAAPVTQELLDLYDSGLEPLLTAAGGPRLALLQREPARNTFPALPVREDEHVLVRFARFDDPEVHAAHLTHLARLPAWGEVQRELGRHESAPAQHLRLQPTARSLLR